MSTGKNEKIDRLDYSKWDNLHVSSDDEEDCHPNIDIKLWKRLQGEKFRKERQEQDDRIEVLDKLIAREIEKPTPDEAKLKKWRKELRSIHKVRKLTPEDLSTVTEEVTIIDGFRTKKITVNGTEDYREEIEARRKAEAEKKSRDEKEKKKIIGAPLPPDALPAAASYKTFKEASGSVLEKYLKLPFSKPKMLQTYLEENPELMCQQCTGWLLMKALEQEMLGKRSKTKKIVRKYLIVQSILDFANQSRKPMMDSLRQFFGNMIHNKKDFDVHFNAEVDDFTETVAGRAKIKRRQQEAKRKAEEERLEKERQERERKLAASDKSSEKLDAGDVFMSLPSELQDAFKTRDLKMLNEVLNAMPLEDAKRHMSRAQRAGLWTPAGESTSTRNSSPDDDNTSPKNELNRKKVLAHVNEDVNSLSVKDLRGLIVAAGLNYRDCNLKSELIDRARVAQAKLQSELTPRHSRVNNTTTTTDDEEEEKRGEGRSCTIQ
eukprot:g982.t1